MIKKYKVNKLFGFRNVNIPFKSDIKILIGENGLGKTTILNSLYYVLSEKWHKLISIDFESIELEFKDKNKIKFKKNELETFISLRERNKRRRIPNEFINQISVKELEFLENESLSEREIELSMMKLLISKKIPRWAPTRIMTRDLRIILHEPIFKKFLQYGELIKSYSVDILYFPTYRRVEEDLKNLGKFRKKIIDPEFEEEYLEDFEDDNFIDDDTLIHFGMEDVEQRIDIVKDLINSSTVEGFSKVTGEILSQLLEGFPDIEQNQIDNMEISTAKIVLHRVGDSLVESDREKILKLLEKPKELLKKKELTYFLFNLIEIYNKHKHVDDAIKNFINVCNRYLEDKEFRYNESTVKIEVFKRGTEYIVSLNKLSSGEKQIISLFSKIYLEFSKNYLVLFDEPELSLSIEWQKQLLPDIVSSNKCKFLLSVTHSPFIFKNELDKFAVGMNSYIKEKK
ncbi:MAG: AAA family ATPase [Candidatus Delongbacteria bacterium]|jgi:predicted ATPase|nr:AAA family ATPase [Candidatus Delongbacteria bacterium]